MNEGTPIIIKKKKGHGGHGHHGGSWKVAYADFVTAMMAFFMVMWIMGLSDQTRAQIAGYFNDPLGVMKTMPRSKAVIDMKTPPPQAKKIQIQSAAASLDQQEVKQVERKMEDALKDAIKEAAKTMPNLDIAELEKQIEITVTPEGLQIELVENTGAAFFESGSAVVRPVAKILLSKIGGVIAKSKRKLIIEGHTDAHPYPSKTYTNWNLSSDRALAIQQLMTSSGVENKQYIQIRGYADTKLKNTKDPYHFSNRRVTLLLPFKTLTEPLLDLPKDEFNSEKQAVVRQPIGVMPSDIDLSQGRAPDEPHSQTDSSSVKPLGGAYGQSGKP